MATLYIANAFSLNMLDRTQANRMPRPIGFEDAAYMIFNPNEFEVRSVVGHPDTAAVFSDLFGEEIPYNRESIVLGPDDILVVGQYKGPRLPEGATELPEGAVIEWWII